MPVTNVDVALANLTSILTSAGGQSIKYYTVPSVIGWEVDESEVVAACSNYLRVVIQSASGTGVLEGIDFPLELSNTSIVPSLDIAGWFTLQSPDRQGMTDAEAQAWVSAVGTLIVK